MPPGDKGVGILRENLLLDILITGFLQGGIYSLIAMGLSLQYGVARIFNVSHGEFIMLTAFLTWIFFTKFDIDPLLCLAIFVPGGFIIGTWLYKLIFRELKKKTPIPAIYEGNCLLASFGLVYVFQNSALGIWGGEIKGYSYLSFSFKIGDIAIIANRLLALIIAIVISTLFYLFLSYTRTGKAIRASAENPEAASLVGVNVDRMLTLCFSLGIAMAVIGGILVSMCYPISATMGLEYTVIAIIVVVLGGLGSISGSFIGGLILGFIGSLVSFWEPSLALVAYYFVFMVLLLIKPTGILRR